MRFRMDFFFLTPFQPISVGKGGGEVEGALRTERLDRPQDEGLSWAEAAVQGTREAPGLQPGCP